MIQPAHSKGPENSALADKLPVVPGIPDKPQASAGVEHGPLGRTAAPGAPADKPSNGRWEPKILAFCCNYCAYAAADLAGSKRMQYPSNVRIIHTPCTGKLEMEHILAAFEQGVDGVLVAGCLEGGCHFQEGNLRARKRTDRIRAMLDEIGVGGQRLLMVNLSAAMAPTFVQRVEEIVQTVRALGPNPLKASAEAKVTAEEREGIR